MFVLFHNWSHLCNKGSASNLLFCDNSSNSFVAWNVEQVLVVSCVARHWYLVIVDTVANSVVMSPCKNFWAFFLYQCQRFLFTDDIQCCLFPHCMKQVHFVVQNYWKYFRQKLFVPQGVLRAGLNGNTFWIILNT